MPKEKKFTYRDLQKCAERELRWRYKVYERRVDAGDMSRKHADTEMELMAEIAAHFRALAENEEPELAFAPSPPVITERCLHLVADNGIAALDLNPPSTSEPQSKPDG